MRLSVALLAPLLFSLVACGQSFSAGAADAGPVDATSGIEASTGDGSTGGTDAADAGAESCGAVPSCPQLGWECGVGQDACGRSVDCGDCTKANETCDPTHQCKCHPLSCSDFNAECGNVPDGCGNTLSCGTCEAGATCGGGGTLQCGTGPCVPSTCASQNAQCGSIEDGCGNIVQCPDTCQAPQTCGGSGNATKCGCTGKTCTGLGWQCGTGDDGCGMPIGCGGCDGGVCDPNAHSCSCVPQKTCATLGYGCGSFTDSCNAVEKCGPAPTPATLSPQCTNASYGHFYACCSPAGTVPDASIFDAGTCNPSGATPPEPGWSCIPSGGAQPAQGWCCAQ